MKIAVACEAGKTTLGPFHNASELWIWHISDGEAVHREPLTPARGCCSALAAKVRGVDIVLCSGLGHGALNHLSRQGTAVACPVTPGLDAAEVVARWLSGANDQFVLAPHDCQHRTPCNGQHDHSHTH